MKYKFRTRPYAHQRKALRKLLSLVQDGLAGGALLMDPRTGKTKVAIDFASILAQSGHVKKVLVICPPKPLGAVWIPEIMTHCPLMYDLIVWDREGRQSKLRQPPAAAQIQFVLMNYEAFSTPGRITRRDPKTKAITKRSKSAGGRYAVKREIRRWVGTDDCLCILDESHKIKSPGGRTSNGIVFLRPFFRFRLILTGTPVTKAKRAFDVYMQWKFLNPDRFADIPTSSEFKNHFGRWVTTAGGFPKWVGPRNLDDLRERVHMDSFSVKRDECFDLPAPKRQVELVPLTKSAKLYDEMAAEMVAELRNGRVIEASIPLVQTLRLAQITSGIAKTTDGRLYRVGREKLVALEPYLDDAKERDEKIIVVARFRADLAAIRNIARDKFNLPVFVLAGGMKRGQSDSDIIQFRRMDDAAVYVVQPSAGSLGIDLSTASRMVWYSLTTSWVDYSQCSDRIALSLKQTQFIYLLGQNTVDEELFTTLEEDGNVARLITTRPEKLLRTTPGAVSSRIIGNSDARVVNL